MSRQVRRGVQAPSSPYEGIALLADPIHSYILFTVPQASGERTEKDLIDTPWVQRLRKIHQLQSTWWVYPAGEHSRFPHVLGTMHVAGRFARHLYPTLREVIGPDLPSPPYIEELVRITGLLHDVGHGPFGHFFDEHFLLPKYGKTHEDVGISIIRERLAPIIRGIRRSPRGPFGPGERLDPAHIAFLMKKPGGEASPRSAAPADRYPRWLQFLQPLFSGIYTADNLDYVQRDAYMTGFSLDLVDIERLLLYSFITRDGLTLHKAGESALIGFINAKFALYANVYYHRTTRAIDLHLQEIFQETLDLLFPRDPLAHLDAYLLATDWYVIEQVTEWARGRKGTRQWSLGREWEKILNRTVKWKMVFDRVETIGAPGLLAFARAEELEEKIRKHLPERLQGIPFKVDRAAQDPRPLNPLKEGEKRIAIFDPATGATSFQPLQEMFKHIPAKVAHYRVFARDRRHAQPLAKAALKILGLSAGEAIPTNV